MIKDMFRIGLIVRAQGLRGEVKIQPLTDDASRFHELKEVIVERDGIFTDAGITVNRIDKRAVYAYIEGFYTRDAADSLRNAYVCVKREDSVDLPDNSWFIADLIGLAVYVGQNKLGTLCEVLHTGGVDVYDVVREDGTHTLFPALKRVIRSVDTRQGIMELDAEALSEVRVDED